MARAILGPVLLGPEQVVRRRPKDMGSIYGHSPNDVHPLTPAVLSRPGRQGAYEGASIDQAPGYTNDTLINRKREYIFRRPYAMPTATASGNISWRDSGPIKDIPTFRFNRNIRPLVGGAHPERWGLHTNIPSGVKSGTQQLPDRKKMKAGKQNRLTVQRYRGQSFSSTTQVMR
jgi:hypothetical protein